MNVTKGIPDPPCFDSWARHMPEKYQVTRWSLAEFLDEAEACKGGQHWNQRSLSREWDDGVSSPGALKCARSGNLEIVSKLMLDVDKYKTLVAPGPAFRTVNGYAGTVSVGRYLAGRPDCMRSRRRVETNLRQVNIYVGTVCSAVIDARSLLRRGAIILGFLETLRNMQVTVDVYQVIEHGALQVIEIPSRPLDLSVCGFALAHPAFTRNLAYTVSCKHHSQSSDWPPGRMDHMPGDRKGETRYISTVRRSIGMTDADIFIPSVYSGDDAVLADPKKWLETNIEQIVGKLQ